MELDNLKGAWQQQAQQATRHLVSDEELLAMLRVRANNAIDLLKRSVRFELWFTVLFVLACVVAGVLSADQTVRMMAVTAIILSCGFGFYYFKKLALLNTLQVENRSIKEHLTKFITQFEKYLWFYRWGYNLLIPFALLAGALAGLHASSEPDFSRLLSQVKLWLILVAVLVPLAILFNYGMKWYLQKLYGTYLARLRAILLELQDS